MKKLSVMLVFAVALAAFAAAPAVMACGENASKTTASNDKAANKLVSGKSSCSASEKTAQLASDDAAACGAKYTLVAMNIKGMTCGGCEESVKTALANVEGVMSVKEVSYESGTAKVYIDKAKMKDNNLLTTAVSNKGYVAEVIPAVAKTQTVNSHGKTCTAAEKAACAKTCTAAEKAACAKTCTAAEKAACAAKAKDQANATAASAAGTK